VSETRSPTTSPAFLFQRSTTTTQGELVSCTWKANVGTGETTLSRSESRKGQKSQRMSTREKTTSGCGAEGHPTRSPHGYVAAKTCQACRKTPVELDAARRRTNRQLLFRFLDARIVSRVGELPGSFCFHPHGGCHGDYLRVAREEITRTKGDGSSPIFNRGCLRGRVR
jgi:hypothetical protein